MANQDNLGHGQQPDFDAMRSSYATLAENVSLYGNIPAFNNGTTLLEEIRGIRNDMTSELREVRVELDSLRTTVGNLQTTVGNLQTVVGDVRSDVGFLRTELRADRYNAMARTENSSSRKSECVLVCLKDISTNELIPNFPSAASDIVTLSNVETTRILTALGLPTNGNLREKRKRVRVGVGILHPIE